MLDNFVLIAPPRAADVSFKGMPYQLSMVRDMLTMVVTGNGESGFDSEEARKNYPLMVRGGSDEK